MSELEPYRASRPDDGLYWFERMQVNAARRQARVDYLIDEAFATVEAAKRALRHRNARVIVKQAMKMLSELYEEVKEISKGDEALELLLYSLLEKFAMELGDDIGFTPMRPRAING
jgi:hypothetical protein